MNSQFLHLFRNLLTTLTLGSLASCSIYSTRVDHEAAALLHSMSDKLSKAGTLRVVAEREVTPESHLGVTLPEKATVEAVVRRPNRLVVKSSSKLGDRAVSYDGKELLYADYEGGTHAKINARADIDSTARAVAEVYGAMPPLVELLANDPLSFLMENVTEGRHAGKEVTDGVATEHLKFQQDGIAWELWIGTADSLPRKMTVTLPAGDGGPPPSMTLRIKNWEMNPVLTATDLRLSVPSNCTAVEMIPLN